MLNIFLFTSFVFLGTLLLGKALERIRIPWIFAALLIGFALAIHNPFADITDSETFVFLSNLGMYFLLFVIGFEINLAEIKREKGFIFSSAFFIVLSEALIGGIMIHVLFHYAWGISFLVSSAFATVGEAILAPILEEFGLLKTKLGRTIIGVGTIDDIIEIVLLIIVALFVGTRTPDPVLPILGSLALLFVMTIGLTRLKSRAERFGFHTIETTFLLTLFLLFLFVGVGIYADAAPLAALLAGISIKNFVPAGRLAAIESEVKTMAYGFFAPLFFLWVGASVNVSYLAAAPLLVVIVVLITNGAKMLASFIIGHKPMGTKQSLLLGIGLSVRFSTSIIIINILFNKGIVDKQLYSVVIASSVVFTFMVPLLLSRLLVRWKIAENH